MRVIYKGRTVLITNYDLQRYSFTKENNKQDIPSVVYDYIQKSGHTNLGDLVFDEEYYKGIEEENKALKEKIKILETGKKKVK